MATLYITSSADSGSGTLRNLISSASDGDVIEPDATLFPHGTVCAITLSSQLGVTKAVSIRGAQTRIQLSGSYWVYADTGSSTTANGKRIVFEDVDFVKLYHSTNGAIYVRYTQYVDFLRCRFVGCSGNNAPVYVYDNNSYTAATFTDCAFYGNRAMFSNSNSRGAIYFAAASVAGNASLVNCTFGANWTAYNGGTENNWNRTVPNTNVIYGTTGWTTPPPSTYNYSTWTDTAYESMDPRPSSTATWKSGATATSSTYDCDGNPRKSSGAQGAYEYYELFWIGKDAQGGAISTGSYDSAVGWSTSRTATSSGSTVPTSVNSVCLLVDGTITGTYTGTVGVGEGVTAQIDIGGAALVGRNATVSMVVRGGMTFENTTLSAPSLTIAPWSYLKLVNTTLNCDSLIIYGALIFNTSITVERLEARDGAFIKMSDDRIFLTATQSALFGDAYFEGGQVAYVFVPEGTSYGDATFDSTVQPGYYGAGLISAAFDTGTLTWTADNLTRPVLIEIERDGKASVYAHQATGGTKIINAEYQFGDSAKAIVVDGSDAIQVTMPTTAPASVLDI